MMTCKECRYFKVHKGVPSQGSCRRYPPVFHRGRDVDDGEWIEVTESGFPTTQAADWCGEFNILPIEERDEQTD